MKKDSYDAVIIGAGIGGLVCGYYFAKAGKKVLPFLPLQVLQVLKT